MKLKQKIIPFVLGVVTSAILALFLLSLDGLVLTTRVKYERLLGLEEEYSKVDEIKDDIMDKFYLGIDEETLDLGMIRGMFEITGDKYSRYMTEEEFTEYSASTNGNYVGIGVLSDVSDDLIHVTKVFNDSPAEKAGILAGDYIIEVDGVSIDEGYQTLIDIMLGEEGTPIEVIVDRDGDILTFNMKRGTVEVPFVESTVIDNIGYLYISQFGTDVSKEFNEHVKKLKKEDIEGLIIDLRDNPGGLVSEATQIADELMGKGLIIYTLNNQDERREYKSDTSAIDLPFVFLSNERSASASEILLGAIKDTETAEIIGTQTFGKGIVQGVSSLKDGSGYKITYSQYFTPSGTAIHEVGVAPDYEVDYEGIIDSDNPNIQEDTQLIKAIEVLQNKLSN
jgi:carboxyl-terminal processing protease